MVELTSFDRLLAHRWVQIFLLCEQQEVAMRSHSRQKRELQHLLQQDKMPLYPMVQKTRKTNMEHQDEKIVHKLNASPNKY